MTNNLLKTMHYSILFTLLAILIPSTSIIASDSTQQEHNNEGSNDATMTNIDSKTLVIYFSRSGSKELMAREITKYYQGSLLELEAEDYRPGVAGLIKAVKDSRSKHAAITPEKLDLSPYGTLFIGSPIWWYSPAPPVWQFIESNDLSDKNVVLFTTFNSSFKQTYIDEFKTQVEGKGGHFIKHIYVKRGRMMRQIDAETLLAKTREELDKLRL